ncbi:MAG: S8 family serine peptidase [Hyphomicrobiaceae bacterium]|nr:S8 family serine peptidase [Hyphomicrobiaceae bacterium]
MMMQTKVTRKIAAAVGVCTGLSALLTMGSQAANAQRLPSAPTIAPGQLTVNPNRIRPNPGGTTTTPGGRTTGGGGGGSSRPSGGGGSGFNVPGAVGLGIGILGAINNAQPRRTPQYRAAPPKKRVRKVKKKTYGPKRTVRRTPPKPRTPAAVVQPIPQFVANEVLILMAPNQPATADAAVARAFNLSLVETNNIAVLNARIVRLRYSDNRPLTQVIAALTADPRVEGVQPNNWYLSVAGKKRKKTSRQYALAKLGIDRAHQLAKGDGVPVAVIDTGVERTHPTLAKSIETSFDAVGDGQPKAQNHGTAIAGVIAGNGQVKGVAPMARVLAARAFYMHKTYKRPMTSSMILLKAIDWSYASGARVFNMSFAGPYDPLVKRALERIHESGAILVAAAGNGGPKAPPAYPAAYKNVIAITAHDAKDKLYRQANRGNYLAVAAPGVNVFVPQLKKSFGFSSGTSVAAAHVSGIIALLLERHPQATSEEIVQALKSGAHDLGRKGFDVEFGAGRADAFASLMSMTDSGVRLSSGR